MLAQIPDGAFGDLMKQQLAQLTGLGGNCPSHARADAAAPAQRTIQPVAKRSLVRGAIAVLLQQPSLALRLGGQHHFQGLRLPGVELLLELLGLVEQRRTSAPAPCWNTSMGVRNRPRCIRLAAQTLPGTEASWTQNCTTPWHSWRNSCWCNVWRLLAKQRQQTGRYMTSTNCASC
jgi:DNA primase